MTLQLPKDLDEAINNLLYRFKNEEDIKLMTESEFIGKTHFGIGMSIRNDWGVVVWF